MLASGLADNVANFKREKGTLYLSGYEECPHVSIRVIHCGGRRRLGNPVVAEIPIFVSVRPGPCHFAPPVVFGTRALGFPRGSILVSFLFEAVVLCLLGRFVGCLATLPFNGLSTGTINQFSEITFSFRFGPRVFAQGVLLALVMGLLGGILPAIRAVRLNIIIALRER